MLKVFAQIRVSFGPQTISCRIEITGYIGYCPHTVTVFTRTMMKDLIYPYYEYY